MIFLLIKQKQNIHKTFNFRDTNRVSLYCTLWHIENVCIVTANQVSPSMIVWWYYNFLFSITNCMDFTKVNYLRFYTSKKYCFFLSYSHDNFFTFFEIALRRIFLSFSIILQTYKVCNRYVMSLFL